MRNFDLDHAFLTQIVPCFRSICQSSSSPPLSFRTSTTSVRIISTYSHGPAGSLSPETFLPYGNSFAIVPWQVYGNTPYTWLTGITNPVGVTIYIDVGIAFNTPYAIASIAVLIGAL